MIIRPILYDIKRTITSKTVLILVGIILLISLAVVPFTSSTGSTSTGWVPVLYYNDGTRFHFLTYVSNQYGDPLAGVHVNVTLTSISVPYGTGQVFVAGQNVTDSSGIGQVIVKAVGTYDATVTVTGPVGTTTSGSSVYSGSPGKVQWFGPYPISTAVDSSNSSRQDIQVFFAGDYGTVPSSISMYYTYDNSSFYYCARQYCFTESNMTLVRNMQSYHEKFDPPLPSGSNGQGIVWVGLFNQTGAPIVEEPFPLSQLRPSVQPSNVPFIASSFFSTVLSFFVPLMVIIGSYSSYGKDRITGVLESILARPVTRRGLAFSRFLSTVLAFSAAVIACVGVVDLLLFHFSGAYLPGDYALAIMGGLVVEVAAFTGLIFLLSHLVKSTGLLLGLSIVIFLILDFLWSIIVLIVTFALGGTLGSEVALRVTLDSYYANPAQFLTLINTYYFQSALRTFIQSSNYGISLPGLVADGLLWATVPFGLFLYLAVKRD